MNARIAIFLPSLVGGGAERVMTTLANAMARDGYEVDLVLAAAKGEYLLDIGQNINVVDLKAERVLAALPRLTKYLRQRRPEVMLSAMTHANLIAIAARWLSGTQTRLVVSERVALNNWTGPSARGLEKIFPQLIRWFYPNADHVVAVSRGISSELVQSCGLAPNKVSTIYNPVELARIQSLAAAPFINPFASRAQGSLVVSAGRLSPQKDFPLLLRAFATVRAKRDAHLAILGAGELRSELEHLAASLGVRESVWFAGFVANPYCWIANADLFVLSSRAEGFPNVLLEALACGTPVVSTDCPTGPGEILENGKWGDLIPVGDVTALACAIEHALDQPRPASAPMERFNLSTITQQWLDVLFQTTSPQALSC